MVQLGTRRNALGLYVGLLVLPTLVLGALHWRALRKNHEDALAAVPGEAADAARRLSDAISRRLDAMIEAESRRPFYEYSRNYFPPGTIGADLAFFPSPLVRDPQPEGLLGWFEFQNNFFSNQPPEIYGGMREQEPSWPAIRSDWIEGTRTLRKLEEREVSDPVLRFQQLRLRHGPATEQGLPYPVVAVNLSPENDVGCLRDSLAELRVLEEEAVALRTTRFHLRFFLEESRRPRAVATRMVLVPGQQLLPNMPSCFSGMRNPTYLLQGFLIDPDWLGRELPLQLAKEVLDPEQKLLFWGDDAPAQSHIVSIDLLSLLDFELPRDGDGRTFQLAIAMDRRNLDLKLRSQELHFLGVAGMLILTLGTGLVLLLRSVNRDLEAARRTSNFVSAVTHELRTPLSAIRLHGEMLSEGWVKDEEQRREYYRRILRESTRLETLVERVLHKGQLTRNELSPEPGDLNPILESLRPTLMMSDEGGEARDLVFELEPDLPAVMLNADCIRSIVINLVENARKYAPVNLDDPASEPILVRTQRAGDEVLIDVLDRGPGIPVQERERIFEAFYRVGNESTRSTKGTGLGLHLVALQAEAMGGRVEVQERSGGGTLFRVHLRLA